MKDVGHAAGRGDGVRVPVLALYQRERGKFLEVPFRVTLSLLSVPLVRVSQSW